MAPFEFLEEKRKYKRIGYSKSDGIYCIVVRSSTAEKTLTLLVVDFSAKGFRFSVIPPMKDAFFKGEKIFLKAIIGSRNLPFKEPIELSIKWQRQTPAERLVEIGCEISSIATESERQFVEFIRSEIRFKGLWGGEKTKIATSDKKDSSSESARNIKLMNVLSLFGGPCDQGNTAKVLGWVEEQLRDHGHTVEQIDLSSKRINGCRRCMKCETGSNYPDCVQQDDANVVIGKMLDSDLVIFASPIYFGGFSSQMKGVIDRCRCLYTGELLTPNHKSFVEGKLYALIATTQHPFGIGIGQTFTTYEEMLLCSKSHSAGKLFVCDCTEPDALGEDVKAQTINFARQLNHAPRCPYAIVIP